MIAKPVSAGSVADSGAIFPVFPEMAIRFRQVLTSGNLCIMFAFKILYVFDPVYPDELVQALFC